MTCFWPSLIIFGPSGVDDNGDLSTTFYVVLLSKGIFSHLVGETDVG
jgi:hypothetical protein